MDPVAQKVINFVMGGADDKEKKARLAMIEEFKDCLLYTSDAADE